MQVQVVENWAIISGKIDAISDHGELSDYASATISVIEVTPVDGYPNLFSWAVGKQIDVNIPKVKVDELGLSAGDSIRARVRKAGPTSAFVDPDEMTKTN
jgi:hypothetical protein